jgi:hypothetical protein
MPLETLDLVQQKLEDEKSLKEIFDDLAKEIPNNRQYNRQRTEFQDIYEQMKASVDQENKDLADMREGFQQMGQNDISRFVPILGQRETPSFNMEATKGKKYVKDDYDLNLIQRGTQQDILKLFDDFRRKVNQPNFAMDPDVVKQLREKAEFENTHSPNPSQYRKFLRTEVAPITTKFKNDRVQDLLERNPHMTEREAKAKAEKESREYFGLGVKPDNRTKKEKVVPCGVLQINLDKLHNNYLKLTYNNNNAVKEIKLTQISPTFRSLVDDILNGKKFSEFKFKKLSDDEKHIYKLMIKKARLAGEVDVRLDQLTSGAIEKLKNEWAKTFGELQAGNDAPQLVKRAKELIQIFIEKRLITRVEGLNLLLKL